MNRILSVGNGAREHAICEALVKADDINLFAFMNKINPGIRRLAKEYHIGDLNDPEGIVKYAKSVKADFAVIGPETPLSKGVVDKLEIAEIPCASPNREMSRIEWSKVFTRNLMREKKIPGCPEFLVFSDKDDKKSIEQALCSFLKDHNNQVAIKPDYLTGGKGVKVWSDHLNSTEEVINYVNEVLTHGNKTVVLEEKFIKPTTLRNSEFTLQAMVSGINIIPMPLVQDFKRAYNDDKGPNTGSMGSYSCADHKLPFLSDNEYSNAITIMEKTAKALGQYKGILYGQFMLTDNGVQLIEFNSRFGDPEAMNVLPLLQDDFSICCEEMIDNRLSKKTWLNKASVCVYLTPRGYPTQPEANKELIVNTTKLNEYNCKLYYASVGETPEGKILTTSSRAIGILGIGDSTKEAKATAYEAVTAVSGDLHFRTDIAEGI